MDYETPLTFLDAHIRFRHPNNPSVIFHNNINDTIFQFAKIVAGLYDFRLDVIRPLTYEINAQKIEVSPCHNCTKVAAEWNIEGIIFCMNCIEEIIAKYVKSYKNTTTQQYIIVNITHDHVLTCNDSARHCLYKMDLLDNYVTSKFDTTENEDKCIFAKRQKNIQTICAVCHEIVAGHAKYRFEQYKSVAHVAQIRDIISVIFAMLCQIT